MEAGRGCQARLKAQASGACPVGVRGFKSHPLHQRDDAGFFSHCAQKKKFSLNTYETSTGKP